MGKREKLTSERDLEPHARAAFEVSVALLASSPVEVIESIQYGIRLATGETPATTARGLVLQCLNLSDAELVIAQEGSRRILDWLDIGHQTAKRFGDVN